MGKVKPFKRAYQSTWGKSAKREILVKEFLEEIAPCAIVEGPGIGVGSTELLSGKAEDYGKETSGADWQVKGTAIFIEVTGPTTAISPHKPLWIRPDKINAARFRRDRMTWVVHCSHDNKLLRTVFLDPRFFQEMRWGNFELIEVSIRGNLERYYAIPSDSVVVRPIISLVNFIRFDLEQRKAAGFFYN
jgi:hypothetical protein